MIDNIQEVIVMLLSSTVFSLFGIHILKNNTIIAKNVTRNRGIFDVEENFKLSDKIETIENQLKNGN